MVSSKQLYINFKETFGVEETVENLNSLMEYALFVDDFDVVAYCGERLLIEVPVHDIETGLQDLMLKIRPESEVVKKIRFNRLKKVLISAASFFVVLFSVQLVSQGTGKEFFKVLFSGKDKQLFLETDVDGERTFSVFVPDGFYISEYSKEGLFFGSMEITYYTSLEDPDIFLHYQIQTFTSGEKTSVEIETGQNMEPVSINGKNFFITNNYELNQITWYEGIEVHHIYGNISQGRLRKIIITKEEKERK